MKSSLPKVLHAIFGRPMLYYVLDAAHALDNSKIVVVAGSHSGGAVIDSLETAYPNVSIAIQREQKGTAHALSTGLKAIKDFNGTVIVINGDTPLISGPTLKKFLARHRKAKNSVSVASFMASDPGAYGRIIRDGANKGISIVEAPDATDEELQVSEVNSGIYAIEPDALGLLTSIRLNQKKKEYYLTDILALAQSRGLKAGAFVSASEFEFMGINNRMDLVEATKAMQWMTNASWLDEGVTMLDPVSTFIDPRASIGADTLIYPNVHIEGISSIGAACTIMPNVRIRDSRISSGVTIKDGSVIEDSVIGKDTQVGPYAHLRPGAELMDDVRIGNFVEVKKSVIGKGTKAMHLSYIGDATIGKNVNVGAGTITCNYDGKLKHRTDIADGVFIGSDTQLVAPVKVGQGAYIGAGTTVTEDVPAHALVISRVRQRRIDGWALAKGKK